MTDRDLGYVTPVDFHRHYILGKVEERLEGDEYEATFNGRGIINSFEFDNGDYIDSETENKYLTLGKLFPKEWQIRREGMDLDIVDPQIAVEYEITVRARRVPLRKLENTGNS